VFLRHHEYDALRYARANLHKNGDWLTFQYRLATITPRSGDYKGDQFDVYCVPFTLNKGKKAQSVETCYGVRQPTLYDLLHKKLNK